MGPPSNEGTDRDPNDIQILAAAFDLVADAKDWRAPIRAFVTAAQLDESGLTLNNVIEAVTHYTATGARVHPIAKGERHELGEGPGYVVTAKGYRAGPAGP